MTIVGVARHIRPWVAGAVLAAILGLAGPATAQETVLSLGSGNFVKPTGVAVDSAGNVFVVDSTTSELEEIAFSDHSVTRLAVANGNFLHPEGLSIDGSGNLYVADTGNNVVKQVLAQGGYTVVNTIGNLGGATVNQPISLAFDGSGDLFVASSGGGGSVIMFSPLDSFAVGNALQFTPSSPGPPQPSPVPNGITFDSGGNMFITDVVNRVLYEVNAADLAAYLGLQTSQIPITVLDAFPTGQPFGVAVEGTFQVDQVVIFFVTDQENGTVPILNGRSPTNLPGPYKGPTGIAFDAAGNIYVADTGDAAIKEVVRYSTTVLTLPSSPVLFGASVTFTATITGASDSFDTPDGVVTFLDGGSVLGTGSVVNGVASFSTAALGAGSHSITARYGGSVDAAFASSTSAAATLNVILEPPTIAIGFGPDANPQSVGVGQEIALNFTITNPNAQTLTGVTFSNTLPAGLTFPTPAQCSPFPPGCTIDGNTITVTGLTIPSGSVTYSYNVLGATVGLQNDTTSAISSNESGTGTTSNTASVTVIPWLNSVSPNSGPVGTTLTLSGAGFDPNPVNDTVMFDAAPATVTAATATSLTVIAPNVAAGPIDVTVTVAGETSATVPYTYTLTMSPTTLPDGAVASVYNQIITASNGRAPYTYAITAGALPAGLSLNSGTGAITGTPTAGDSVTFTVTATDSASNHGSQAYSINVAAPSITLSPASGTLPQAQPNVAYNQTISASGGTSGYTFAVTGGALPPGLTLSPAGLLAGTPTAPGQFNFTIQATDSSTGTGPYHGTASYALVIGMPTVGSVSPSAGPTTGGTTVTITGTNLSNTTAVHFGANAATNFTLLSDTQITATSPAGNVGTVDITVANAGGTSATSAVDQFTYRLPSFVVTPGAGANGTISPDTPQTIAQGQTASFSVTPESGYSASATDTCGAGGTANGALSGATYTTGPITAPCTVTASFTQIVLPVPTVGMSVSPNPPIANQALTITATVATSTPASQSLHSTMAAVRAVMGIQAATAATPGGTVTFTDNGTTLGTVPLNNGSASTIVASPAAGPHTLVASYSGDANNAPASTSITVTVNAAVIPTAPVQAPALSSWALLLLALSVVGAGWMWRGNS